jgi:DNA polymerase-3 subunit epsilon
MFETDVVVLDFETTGLSPAQGDRPIEIGAVVLRGGRVVDQFESLMNPGFRVNSFIESFTGISNAMLAPAPPCEAVMEQFAQFIGDRPLVAHNASFDSKFLHAELLRLGRTEPRTFACTMLNARRIYPQAPGHKLGNLVTYLGIPSPGQAHRALADAQMAAGLWNHTVAEVGRRCGLETVPFEVMRLLGKAKKNGVEAFLAQWACGENLDPAKKPSL